MKEREKKVFPLHCAIMGFQIIYCTKVITVNFSLCENSAPGPSLSKESGLHREQKKLLVSEWGMGEITSRKTTSHFILNALGEDSCTVLKVFLVPVG